MNVIAIICYPFIEQNIQNKFPCVYDSASGGGVLLPRFL